MRNLLGYRLTVEGHLEIAAAAKGDPQGGLLARRVGIGVHLRAGVEVEELGLEKPDPRRALRSALTIGGSYVVGGAIPLLPYALRLPLASALIWSVVVTLVALLIFGAVKARFTGISLFRGAWQTALVGGLAAGAAYGLARVISGLEH